MDNKSSLFNIEKFVKSSNIPSERLASLKLPRDLNLGGSKPKKIYAPNLNVIRNKDKNRDKLKKNENKFRRGNEKRQGLKQKEINSSRYVQSSGIFSEGTAEIKRPSQSFAGKISNYSERDKVSSIVMPKFNRNSWNVNTSEEATIASDLMVCDDDDDSSTDIEYEPVILPLDKNKELFSRNFTISNEEIKIKEEVKDEFVDASSCTDYTKLKFNSKINVDENKMNWLPTCSFNVKRKFTDEENIISLIRLPDSLPSKLFTEESDVSEDYTVDQLMEGQLGKIIIRKSGKMEVVIANTRYHLECEETSFFSEEVVMFPGKNSTSKENSLISLGPLEEKFSVIPQWDLLFEDTKTQT